MKLLSKGFSLLYFWAQTRCMRIRYRNNLKVDGVLKKRCDTQMIISSDGRIQFGEGVSFQRNVSLSAVSGGGLVIGSNVFFNRNCIVICRKIIRIGNNVLFGPGVTIYDHDHKFSHDCILSDEYNLGSVVIEDGCWIGANVTILRDTHIGKGCVIGAGVVVKGNIPDHSLVISNRELDIIPIVSKNSQTPIS